MLGSSSIAAQLAASQEGLSSLKLVPRPEQVGVSPFSIGGTSEGGKMIQFMKISTTHFICRLVTIVLTHRKFYLYLI
jgi:hypothetical protein